MDTDRHNEMNAERVKHRLIAVVRLIESGKFTPDEIWDIDDWMDSQGFSE